MEKTIIKPTENNAKIEERSFEQWLRSHGERRDDLQGLTTNNAGQVLVPKEISTPILELTQDKPTLANYITRRAVNSSAGTLPVATAPSSVIMHSKKELAEVEDADAELLRGVDYRLQTFVQKILVSEEEMEDSAIDLAPTIKQQLQQIITNTENANIVSILTADGNFQTANADLSKNIDDVKRIKNIMLDPQLDVQIVMPQTIYNTLDTMKDSEGRYLFSPSITAPSGKSLLGADVIVVRDTLMPAGKMFIGSLAESVLEAYRPQITAQYREWDVLGFGFLAGLRADWKPVAKESGVLIDLGSSASSGTAGK